MKPQTILMALSFAATCCDHGAYATAADANDLVGTSIGADLLLDSTFGDAGSALLRFNDDSVTAYSPVRVISDAGGYWLLGEHYAFLGDSSVELAVAHLRADGSLDTAFGSG